MLSADFVSHARPEQPAGISPAPEFQKRVDSKLSGLAGVVCYLDDILVIARNQREHDERLTAVLDRLVKCGLMLNVDKCAFSVGTAISGSDH